MIAKAISQSLGANFYSLSGPDIFKPRVGEGEGILQQTFENARREGNSVIFIDEIDAIAQSRGTTNAEHIISLVNKLLALMDGTESHRKVMVIGATNRVSTIDAALRRPGRFDLEFEVPIPDKEARLDILSKYFNFEGSHNFDNGINTNFLKDIAEITNGYSGADLFDLYRRSVFHQLRGKLDYHEDTGKIFLKDGIEVNDVIIHQKDVLGAIKEITPSTMRGKGQPSSLQFDWDSLIGFQHFQNKLKNIHLQLDALLETDNIEFRPNHSNLAFIANNELDKRVLAISFAKRFGYEFIELDLLDEALDDRVSVLQLINQAILKAKQVAPSVLYLTNFELSENPNLILRFLFEKISILSSKSRIVLIVSAYDKQIDLSAIKYIFDFNQLYSEEDYIEEYYRQLSAISLDSKNGLDDVKAILQRTKSIQLTTRELKENAIIV